MRATYGITLWKIESWKPKPSEPLHSSLKFRQVFGATSPKSPTTILPAASPPTEMSKKTLSVTLACSSTPAIPAGAQSSRTQTSTTQVRALQREMPCAVGRTLRSLLGLHYKAGPRRESGSGALAGRHACTRDGGSALAGEARRGSPCSSWLTGGRLGSRSKGALDTRTCNRCHLSARQHKAAWSAEPGRREQPTALAP
eukprot:scaffold21_cov368-Prasinococcus_capsulatus_cf.AAC.10